MSSPFHFLVTILSIFGSVYSATLRQGARPAIFLGDSLTYRWRQAGTPVWAEYYTPIGALNLGVDGHQTSDTIKIIESGGIDNLIGTKVTVLLVGGNDLLHKVSPDIVASNIQKIISMTQDRLPDTRILLLGLIPAGLPDHLIQNGRTVNEMISKYDDGDKVRFLNMRSSFRSVDGGPNLELYQPDRIHLNVKGYQVWASIMDPLFKELLTHE